MSSVAVAFPQELPCAPHPVVAPVSVAPDAASSPRSQWRAVFTKFLAKTTDAVSRRSSAGSTASEATLASTSSESADTGVSSSLDVAAPSEGPPSQVPAVTKESSTANVTATEKPSRWAAWKARFHTAMFHCGGRRQAAAAAAAAAVTEPARVDGWVRPPFAERVRSRMQANRQTAQLFARRFIGSYRRMYHRSQARRQQEPAQQEQQASA